MDWVQGRLMGEGRFSYRDLRLPLALILSFLKAAGMHSLAERLLESVVLQRFGLTGLAAAITVLVAQGWMYVDNLLDMLKLDLNIFRARQHLACAMMPDIGTLIEARSTPRQIRLGIEVEIVQL